MMQDPIRRSRTRSILIIVILSTIPCYLLGLIVLWISNNARGHITPTPTITVEVTQPPVKMTPTLPVPTAIFATPTITTTPTISVTPSPSATYFIPSSTPSVTPLPTDTETPSAPTNTNTPELTPSNTTEGTL